MWLLQEPRISGVTQCVDEHLGYFYLLALWVMLLWTQISKHLFKSLLSILLCTCISKIGTVGSYSNSVCDFWGNPILFSTVAASFYIPTSNAYGFQFLYILTNTCFLLPGFQEQWESKCGWIRVAKTDRGRKKARGIWPWRAYSHGKDFGYDLGWDREHMERCELWKTLISFVIKKVNLMLPAPEAWGLQG